MYGKFIFELRIFEVEEKYTELKKNLENYYYSCTQPIHQYYILAAFILLLHLMYNKNSHRTSSV